MPRALILALRAGVHIGAAAGGEDLRPGLQQAGDNPRFTLTKIRLAVLGEDLAHGLARGDFDLVVGVGEGEFEPIGKPAAHRRLAGSHQADQHDAPCCKGLADPCQALGLQFFLALSQSKVIHSSKRRSELAARRDPWRHGSTIFSC